MQRKGNPPNVRVTSELLPLLFSRFQGIFENDYKKKRELHFVVTPSFSRIRTNGLEPSRCYSLEPETSASTNSATCAFDWCGRSLAQVRIECKRIPQKSSKKLEKCIIFPHVTRSFSGNCYLASNSVARSSRIPEPPEWGGALIVLFMYPGLTPWAKELASLTGLIASFCNIKKRAHPVWVRAMHQIKR